MQGSTGSEPIKCIKISWGPHTVVTKVGLNDPYSNFSKIFRISLQFLYHPRVESWSLCIIQVNIMGTLCAMIC